MEKIKDFLSLWFSEEFWRFVCFLLVVTVVSTGAQSLLFWIGGLFPSVEDCGMWVDTILGALLVLPPFIGAGLTEHKGNGYIIVGLLAIMGLYISVVWYFHAGILVGCLVLLYTALWKLRKQGCNMIWIYDGACVGLLYCIGAYYAMTFSGLDPAINIYGIVTLIVVMIGGWLIPATEY